MDTLLEKSDIMQTIRDLHEEVSLEQLIDRLIFIEKVKGGLESAENGKLIPHEQVKKEVSKWSK